MSDKGKPFQISIDGIDFSEHVKQWHLEETVDELFPGVRRFGPVVIEGRWDDGTKKCVICGSDFVPGPEGILTVTVENTGQQFTPVCHACGTSLMSPSD